MSLCLLISATSGMVRPFSKKRLMLIGEHTKPNFKFQAARFMHSRKKRPKP